MDVSGKVKEAETYHSMGLLDESLLVYEQILSETAPLEPSLKDSVTEKVTELKAEIESFDSNEAVSVSAEDIAFFKKTLSIKDDFSEVLESAGAFKELGLFREALVEYAILLRDDQPWDEVIADMATCLLNGYSPSEVVSQAQKCIDNTAFENPDKARVSFELGREIEKRENKELAHEFYTVAHQLNPENKEIKKKFETTASGLSYNSRYDYLIRRNKISTKQLQQALTQSKRTKKSVEFVLLETFKITIDDLGKSLSLFYNRPFKTYDPGMKCPYELIRNLKKAFLLNMRWVPLSWEKDKIEILIDDPKDLGKTDQIQSLMKTDKISFCVGIDEHIVAFIDHFFDEDKANPSISETEENVEFDSLLDIEFEEDDKELEKEMEEELIDESSSQVVKLIDQLIISAFRKNVSDIHLEPVPESQCVNVRFRIDGICQDYFKVPISMARGMISRVKIMAQLDISERRLPQDGKIKFKRKGLPVFELRVATLPTTGGFEDAVLRILSRTNALELDKIGLSEKKLSLIEKIITQPYGLMLVVGPTGSGKTTTLHSALSYINKPGVKIWTAEDPVEITQQGLRQVEAKPQIGLDFARVMRAFLRADPDVIMIGEMRDQETASIALEASLTGHLVFSTLHTNSSAETVTRVLDMGFNPIYFADALLGVLAQRLVRTLCPECRKPHQPSKQEFEEIVSEYGKADFASTGIKHSPDLSLYNAAGCESCSETGYSGRIAIHELLVNDAEIKNMIKRGDTTENIFKKSVACGMTTLKQDGIKKVFDGLTDMREVRRVCIN